MTAPLVVTATLDGPAQRVLDELRRRTSRRDGTSSTRT